MASYKFKRGDLVIVDETGQPAEFEIVSPLRTGKGLGSSAEFYYDAKEISSGKRKTISEDEILRLATPVDNSAQLFKKEK